MTAMVDWALKYSDLGLAVFPLHGISLGRCTCGNEECSSPGKHPMWDAQLLPDGVKSATHDKAIISQWWEKWPNANIAIATGWMSGLLVVDFDGVAGRNSFLKLQKQHGKWPATLTARTGKGGHLVYHTGLAAFGNKTALFPGVDIRADGGYIVAAPSTHVSGKRYEWTRNGPMAPAPQWLRDTLQGKEPATQRAPAQQFDGPKPHKSIDDHPSIGDGGRNAGLFSLGSRWVWEELWTSSQVEDMLQEANRKLCQPPLSQREVSRIARNVLRQG